MPKVLRKKKARAGKPPYEYRCVRCPEPIGPGDQYYQWAFRYGGIHRQHVAHGHPRPSQLTMAKMAEVYAAQEDLQDFEILVLQELSWEERKSDAARLAEAKEHAEECLEDAMNRAQEVAQEYEDAIEAMPASEEQNREKIDGIEEWVQALDQAKGEAADVDLTGDTPTLQDAVDFLNELVHNAANELNV